MSKRFLTGNHSPRQTLKTEAKTNDPAKLNPKPRILNHTYQSSVCLPVQVAEYSLHDPSCDGGTPPPGPPGCRVGLGYPA